MGELRSFNRRRAVSAADIRIMVWIGLILGLLVYQASRLWPTPPSGEGIGPVVVERTGPAPVRASPAAVRVIDGDTFDHGGVRIRVADIDTPEVEGDCAHERALAARATRRMETLLAAGPFELRPGGDGRDEDRYGRKLRIVTRGGRSLGAVLVAEGLARAWTGRRRPWC